MIVATMIGFYVVIGIVAITVAEYRRNAGTV